MQNIENQNISKELDILLKYITHTLMEELPTLVISPEYLVLAIIQKRDCLANQLLNEIIPAETLLKIHTAFYELVSRKSLTAVRPNSEPKYSEQFLKVFDNAHIELENIRPGIKLNSLHVLLALLSERSEESAIKRSFETAKADYNTVLQKAKEIINELFENTDDIGTTEDTMPHPTQIIIADNMANPMGFIQNIMGNRMNVNVETKNTALDTMCVNLNEQAKKGNIDPTVGREKELKNLINVLGRRKKNNAIVVGPEGVGKTNLCEGLARMIVDGKAPTFLANKTIWSLNLGSLVSGTQFRGLLEEKMQRLIEALKKGGDNILYIDDISAAFSDKKNSDVDFATLLNSALINNEFQIIGSCGFKGYRTSFDANPSLARKFQKIIIDEPTEDEAFDILNNVHGAYEDYHKIKYDDGVLLNCIKLAKKYIPERHLPDSAIDLMDECGAKESINADNSPAIVSLQEKKKAIEDEIENLKKNDGYDKIDEKKKELSQVSSDLIKEKKLLSESRKNNPITITNEMLFDYVSQKTGIPISRLSVNEKQSILSMEEVIKRSVVGQDEAVNKICRAIKRNRVGLGGRKTMGAFLLCGPTGVGKTFLGKQLAKEIFGDEKYLVRIDMSEYEDKTSVNKLIGSSAGYVGYENGGVLTETIKNKKYCVLLLDEFEKANAEIYNLFLQVFDEGFLSDNTGQKIDFKNIIVLLTSNIGAKMASEFGKGIGFSDTDNTSKILEKELKHKFSPEFLNRLDDIIYFNKLTDDNIREITKLELGKLNTRLKDINCSISYDDKVIEYIYGQMEEREYGARPILRIIQDKIENPITDLILENDYSTHNFKISYFSDNNSLIIN